jgi:CubicO group peptidase (beta-lactamase class C family)
LVDEGILRWEDPVKKWLPEFEDTKGEATLAQLLSHTAGYPDYQPQGNPVDISQELKSSVDNILPIPADTLSGTKFKYGGLSMQVAGRIAELASGKSWEELFQEKLLDPLK